MKENKSSGEIFRKTSETEYIRQISKGRKQSQLEKIVGRISAYYSPYRLFD